MSFVNVSEKIIEDLFDLECDMLILSKGKKKITKAALKRFAKRLKDIRNDIQI